MNRFLVIQTAFIGDAILATAVLEKLHRHFPNSQVDILVRKGNESLFDNHPFLHEVLVWNKKTDKYTGLWALLRLLRKRRYDLVVNLQRFFSTGFLTAFSGAAQTAGFDKNPWSFAFTHHRPHVIGGGLHEVARHLSLIAKWTDDQLVNPRLYPSGADFRFVRPSANYLTISPASVWHTKQWPEDKWAGLIEKVEDGLQIFLLGGKGDADLCNRLKGRFPGRNIEVLAGKLSFLQSAALMKNARMNFVNDSAPLHLASAVSAPVTAVFCSTVPSFGFGPLSDQSVVIETEENLACRPCGLHGRKSCPLGHFRCANIAVERLLANLR